MNHIVSISSGNNHTLILYSDGQVKGIGYNRENQLGIDNSTTQYGIVTKSRNLSISNVIQIIASGNQSYFLTNEGKIYTCGGSNTSIVPIIGFENIIHMFCSNHSIFGIDRNGNVFVSGFVEFLRSKEYLYDTNIALQIPNVSEIISGYGYTEYNEFTDRIEYVIFLIRKDGRVYVMGDNHNLFRLGPKMHIPELLWRNDNNIQVITNHRNSFFLKANGNVYAEGLNFNDMLGQGVAPIHDNYPFIGNKDIVKIWCTSYALFWLDISGNGYYKKISDSYSFLQIQDMDVYSIPLLDIVDIFPFENSIYVLIADGSVYVSGTILYQEFPIKNTDQKEYTLINQYL